MLELIKMLNTLRAKGFATAGEKSQVEALYKEMGEDEQGAVDTSDVAAMPENDPAAEAEVQEEVAKAFKKASGDIKSELQSELTKSVDAMKSDIEKFISKSQTKTVSEPSLVEKRAKMNTWIRSFSTALLGNDVATVKELTTDSTGSPFGGYVVDSELSAEIRHLVTQFGVARREFFTTQLSKNSYEANALTTDVSISWVDEGAVIPSTQVVLNQEELKLKKLGAIVTLTRELLEDQEIDLFSFIATRVAEGFAKAEDTAFFAGDGEAGSGGFTGLLENADVVDVDMASTETAFTDMDADHLYGLIDALPEGAHANAKFYMNRTIMGIVRKLKAEGDYIFQRPSETGPATIWGYPVVMVEVMPGVADTAVSTPFVLFGDLRKSSILGFRGGIGADRFNAGVVRNVAANADINLVTSDREAIRWIERVGALTILPSAVVRLTTAAS